VRKLRRKICIIVCLLVAILQSALVGTYAPYAVSSNGTVGIEPDIEKILEQGIEREAIEAELMNTAGLLPDDAIGGGSKETDFSPVAEEEEEGILVGFPAAPDEQASATEPGQDTAQNPRTPNSPEPESQAAGETNDETAAEETGSEQRESEDGLAEAENEGLLEEIPNNGTEDGGEVGD